MRINRVVGRSLLGLVAAGLVALVCPATGAAAGPAWHVESEANTTALPGETITYHVTVRNIGDADSDGSLTTTTFALPAGLTGVSAAGRQAGVGLLDCTAGGAVLGSSTIQCATNNVVPDLANGAGQDLRYKVVVAVGAGVVSPSTLTAAISVTGGGAADVSWADPTRIDSPPGFGLDAFDGQISADVAGAPSSQAGGHPYAITTSLDFNTVTNPLPIIGDLWPVEPVKDALVDLPPGLVGSPAGVDQCTSAQLANGVSTSGEPLCPATSQIGTVLVRINGFVNNPFILGPYPVFNMVPPPGTPARFGFNVVGVVVTLSARLRSNSDYGISVDGNDLSQGLAIAGTTITFWGVPSDPSHTPERACPGIFEPASGGPTCPSGAPPRAFLRNPTSCTPSAGSPVQDGLATNIAIDSWDHPGARDANGEAAAGDVGDARAAGVSEPAVGVRSTSVAHGLRKGAVRSGARPCPGGSVACERADAVRGRPEPSAVR